jgi:hypothetical protein
MLPNIAHFPPTITLGMKHRLEGQNKVQRQYDFKDNSDMYENQFSHSIS